jgi:NCS2 family nucleobase:cation symporter-2
VVGIALLAGLSVEVVPGLYEQVPAVIHPLFLSALSLGTVLAVVLNMLFRIGVARTREAVLLPEANNLEAVSALMDEQGATWGMRKEVCSRVVHALHEFLVAIQLLGVTSPIKTRLRFDEIELTALLEYRGPALSVPEAAPSAEDLMNGKASVSELSMYMLCQHADRVRVSEKDGIRHVHLHFDH